MDDDDKKVIYLRFISNFITETFVVIQLVVVSRTKDNDKDIFSIFEIEQEANVLRIFLVFISAANTTRKRIKCAFCPSQSDVDASRNPAAILPMNVDFLFFRLSNDESSSSSHLLPLFIIDKSSLIHNFPLSLLLCARSSRFCVSSRICSITMSKPSSELE